jgi:hypothetical protein
MPRSNRPRTRRGEPVETPELDLSRALLGRARTESKRDGVWNVQPVASASAAKVYSCPGCTIEIAVGVAHVVAWRADGLMGEAEDLAARRHWHSHCWKIKA